MGATQSELDRQATQLPEVVRQRGVGFAQSASAAQAATHWCEALQIDADRLVQSVESRHCTQAWCCRSQTGVGGRQSRLEAQPGSAWQTSLTQSLPGPQSRETRQATQIPWATSHTGVAGCDEQSASRAQVPESPGTQHPLAQCRPLPQAASPLQAVEPMQKPELAQMPDVHFCGEGQSPSVEQGRSPTPLEQERQRAMRRAGRNTGRMVRQSGGGDKSVRRRPAPSAPMAAIRPARHGWSRAA
jgi:hypothetical protein